MMVFKDFKVIKYNDKIKRQNRLQNKICKWHLIAIVQILTYLEKSNRTKDRTM